jgi:hypothetical protein
MKNTILIADEFRQETKNKITALGLYTAQAILLERQPGEENFSLEQRTATLPLALDRLGFLFTTTDIVGKHEIYLQIIAPSGEVLMQSNKTTIEIPEHLREFGHSYVIQSNPFIIPEVGNYICRYWVDDTATDFSLLVKFSA